MLGNLGFTEIAILLFILVLFFGAKRIPEIGSSIGKGLTAFKRGLKDLDPSDSAPPPPPNATPSSSDPPKRLTS